MAGDSHLVFITASCHRKPSKVPEALNTFTKNIGKLNKVSIIKLRSVHHSGDGANLVMVDALLNFKTFVNLNKIVKTNSITVLDKKILATNLPHDTLATFNPTILKSDKLDEIRPDLESAIRLFKIGNFSDSAALFLKWIKNFDIENDQDKCYFQQILIYCRCTALLKSKKIDSIHEGYEILTDLNNRNIKNFPLFHCLINKYESVMRKDVTQFPSIKAKDLQKWPFDDVFVQTFLEANPNQNTLEQIINANEEIEVKEKRGKIAMCRFINCQESFNHQPGLPSTMKWTRMIVENEVDYKGFCRVICANSCKIEYHPYCWKDLKSENGIKADKDCTVMFCPTPDCQAVVKEIQRFSPNNDTPLVISGSKKNTATMRKLVYFDDNKSEEETFPKEPTKEGTFDSTDSKMEETKAKSCISENMSETFGSVDNFKQFYDLFKKKVVEDNTNEQKIKELMDENSRFRDQLQKERSESKATLESFKRLEERSNLLEQQIKKLKADHLAYKEKIKKLETDAQVKAEKYEKKDKETFRQCNIVILELCKTVHSKYLTNDSKFALFVENLELSKDGPMNFR